MFKSPWHVCCAKHEYYEELMGLHSEMGLETEIRWTFVSIYFEVPSKNSL
jgi:hypothetical protein